MNNYEKLKKKLIKTKKLFEDKTFPASPESLGELNVGEVIWKRPKEICENPQFIINKATRLDLTQGEIANCWFIAAAVCLAEDNPELFDDIVPKDQGFYQDYAGVFRFRFWKFGSWVEILVDDKLPTQNGKLIFAKNQEETNEFWVPLFEKAYAKMKGSYKSLDGGSTSYALVDFTGGISERIKLTDFRLKENHLFNVIRILLSKSSMIGCEIPIRMDGKFEEKLPNGLYTSHAYSVTKATEINIKGSIKKLLRLKNPWGGLEWIGEWGDNSSKWNQVSELEKNKMQLQEKEDGEFWMSIEDFVNNFEFLTVCHLSPDEFYHRRENQNKEKSDWESICYYAEWIKGFNAGGREDMFINPQFRIKVPAKSDNSNVHVIISLMQESSDWDEQHIIAFAVYQVKKGVKEVDPTSNYPQESLLRTEYRHEIANLREITANFEIIPGNYVIIPFTFHKNETGKFLLRVYTEVEVHDDKRFNTQTMILPGEKNKIEERETDEEVLEELFSKFSKNSFDMDANEVHKSLDYNFQKELTKGFDSLEACRSLVSIFGRRKAGFVTRSEFKNILSSVHFWIDKFKTFDKDKDGSIDCIELSKVLMSIDIQLSYPGREAIIDKYGGRMGKTKVIEFILYSAKILFIYETFKELSKINKIKMNLEEWVSLILRL